ncbi:hypothetical protein BN1708_006609, partial [Verticillium longisporum]
MYHMSSHLFKIPPSRSFGYRPKQPHQCTQHYRDAAHQSTTSNGCSAQATVCAVVVGMNHFPPSIRQQLGSPAQLPATQTSRLAFKRKPLRAWFHGVAVATFAQSLIAGRNFPSTESVGTLDDRNPHSNMFALSPRPAQSSPIQGQQ